MHVGGNLMLTIRPYHDDDLPFITRLFIRVMAQPPWEEPWPADRARDYIGDLARLPRFQGFIAVKDEIIVGVLLGNAKPHWQGMGYFVEELFVDLVYQKQGMGTKLMVHLIDELRAQNISWIALTTGRFAPAFQFYQNLGFRTVDDFAMLVRQI